MPRIARIIAPGTPHHVTQRGNRRMQTFFCDEDYPAYIDLMAAGCRQGNVEVWAYCLMPNHIHMIALPETDDGLRRAIGEAHRRFTRRVNFREGWRYYKKSGTVKNPVMSAKAYNICAIQSFFISGEFASGFRYAPSGFRRPRQPPPEFPL